MIYVDESEPRGGESIICGQGFLEHLSIGGAFVRTYRVAPQGEVGTGTRGTRGDPGGPGGTRGDPGDPALQSWTR